MTGKKLLDYIKDRYGVDKENAYRVIETMDAEEIIRVLT